MRVTTTRRARMRQDTVQETTEPIRTHVAQHGSNRQEQISKHKQKKVAIGNGDGEDNKTRHECGLETMEKYVGERYVSHTQLRKHMHTLLKPRLCEESRHENPKHSDALRSDSSYA